MENKDIRGTNGHFGSRLSFTVLFLFFASATLWWRHLDQSPPAWDDSWYLTNSLVLYDALTDRGLIGFGHEFFIVLGFKAPLIAALPAPLYLLFGRNWHVAYLVNIGAMLLLFLAIYSIARQLANRNAALLSIVVVGSMPLMYGLASWYLVEYALTAVVACALWLLLLSRNLEVRRWTCVLGAVCGLGLLLKASFPLFVAGPLGVALLRSRRRVEALALILLPCAALALPWYALHWRATFANALDAAYGQTPTLAQGTGAIFSFDAVLGYLKAVGADGLSIYYVVLIGLVVISLTSRRDGTLTKALAFCALWIAPILVFIFAGNKDIRYAAPLYPAFGLAIAVALDSLCLKHRWIPFTLLVVPLSGMLATSFGWPYSGMDHRYARRFDRALWPQEQIVKVIAGRAVRNGSILIGTDRSHFNVNNFALALRQQRVPLEIETTAYELDVKALLRAADSASFFLFKQGGVEESPFFNVHSSDVIRHVRESASKDEIPLPADVAALPDGGTAHLFETRRPILLSTLPELPELHANFGGMIELTGLSIERTAGAIEVTFGWRSMRRIDRDYWCFAHIINERNVILGQLDHQLAGGDPPLTEWRTGNAVVETLRRELPVGTAKLRLRIGLYNIPSGQRLRITLPTQSKATLTDDGTALLIVP